jgi:hypothetical protein
MTVPVMELYAKYVSVSRTRRILRILVVVPLSRTLHVTLPHTENPGNPLESRRIIGEHPRESQRIPENIGLGFKLKRVRT